MSTQQHSGEIDVLVIGGGNAALCAALMAREGGAIGIAVTSGSTSADEWASQPPEKTPHLVIENIGELVGKLGLR